MKRNLRREMGDKEIWGEENEAGTCSSMVRQGCGRSTRGVSSVNSFGR